MTTLKKLMAEAKNAVLRNVSEMICEHEMHITADLPALKVYSSDAGFSITLSRYENRPELTIHTHDDDQRIDVYLTMSEYRMLVDDCESRRAF